MQNPNVSECSKHIWDTFYDSRELESIRFLLDHHQSILLVFFDAYICHFHTQHLSLDQKLQHCSEAFLQT